MNREGLLTAGRGCLSKATYGYIVAYLQRLYKGTRAIQPLYLTEKKILVRTTLGLCAGVVRTGLCAGLCARVVRRVVRKAVRSVLSA